jgi:hypothetical protein
MNESLATENLEPEKNFESKEMVKKKEVTPVDILNDTEKIKKLLETVDTGDGNIDYYGAVIEFGEEFLPVDVDAILFYLSCELGLIDSLYGYNQGFHGRIIRFLKLQKDNSSLAEEYRVKCLEELRQKNINRYKAIEYLRENYDLSKIISGGVPQTITEPTIFIQNGLINNRPTEYLGEIKSQKDDLEHFNEIVKGKIVID